MRSLEETLRQFYSEGVEGAAVMKVEGTAGGTAEKVEYSFKTVI